MKNFEQEDKSPKKQRLLATKLDIKENMMTENKSMKEDSIFEDDFSENIPEVITVSKKKKIYNIDDKTDETIILESFVKTFELIEQTTEDLYRKRIIRAIETASDSENKVDEIIFLFKDLEKKIGQKMKQKILKILAKVKFEKRSRKKVFIEDSDFSKFEIDVSSENENINVNTLKNVLMRISESLYELDIFCDKIFEEVIKKLNSKNQFDEIIFNKKIEINDLKKSLKKLETNLIEKSEHSAQISQEKEIILKNNKKLEIDLQNLRKENLKLKEKIGNQEKELEADKASIKRLENQNLKKNELIKNTEKEFEGLIFDVDSMNLNLMQILIEDLKNHKILDEEGLKNLKREILEKVRGKCCAYMNAELVGASKDLDVIEREFEQVMQCITNFIKSKNVEIPNYMKSAEELKNKYLKKIKLLELEINILKEDKK